MKVTKYTGLIGAFFIILTLASFIGFWAYLIGDLQTQILVHHKEVGLFDVLLLGAAAALVFNFCGLVGIKCIAARKFDQEYIQFKPAKSKAFWQMYLVTLIIYSIFILVWHGEL